MLYSSQEDAIADGYFAFINDVIGILALTLAATSLQFEHAEPFAWTFFIVIILWTFSKGKEYKRIAKRYVDMHPGIIGKVRLFWKMKIYLIGVTFLFFTALGKLNLTVIYGTFGL